MGDLKFEVGKFIKIETAKKMEKGGKSRMKISGEICEVTKKFIVVKRENYKECFLISSFICGDLKIVGGKS